MENTLESDISSLRKKLEEENPSDAVKSEIYKELGACHKQYCLPKIYVNSRAWEGRIPEVT